MQGPALPIPGCVAGLPGRGMSSGISLCSRVTWAAGEGSVAAGLLPNQSSPWESSGDPGRGGERHMSSCGTEQVLFLPARAPLPLL